MAKIDFPDTISSFFNPIAYTGIKAETKKTKGKVVRENQKSRFSSILEHITGNTTATVAALEEFPVSEETIKALLDEVHSTGDDLKTRPLPLEIMRYKQAVKNFLHYVVKNSYSIDKQVSGANLLKRKSFTRIQVVDRKLEQLAAGILAGQTTQLEILARIEEITGLLIDLLQ
jgi:uncharacterized protein YaaR (DUF327 family)